MWTRRTIQVRGLLRWLRALKVIMELLKWSARPVGPRRMVQWAAQLVKRLTNAYVNGSEGKEVIFKVDQAAGQASSR